VNFTITFIYTFVGFIQALSDVESSDTETQTKVRRLVEEFRTYKQSAEERIRTEAANAESQLARANQLELQVEELTAKLDAMQLRAEGAEARSLALEKSQKEFAKDTEQRASQSLKNKPLNLRGADADEDSGLAADLKFMDQLEHELSIITAGFNEVDFDLDLELKRISEISPGRLGTPIKKPT